MNRDLLVIYATAFLRSVAVSGLSILFGLYLAQLGLSDVLIGAVIASGLLGMATGTLCAARWADRLGRRRFLAVLALAMAAGGLALAWGTDTGILFAASFVGMVNGMGRDRGALQAVDLAILAQVVPDSGRTTSFARYTLLTDIASSAGALLAALPQGPGDMSMAILVYAVVSLAAVPSYALLSADTEVRAVTATERSFSPQTRRHIVRFASLSALDSIGGGFITRSLLTYWFVSRFGQHPGTVGPLFAVASLVNAAAYPVAAWLARRFGLVKTMVFTHIPSSILLMMVPLMPSFPLAALLYIVREFFAPMDVPTRQSYLAAIVADHERSAAAGIVNTVRNASWSAGPALAGWAMSISLSAPLYFAGILKIMYDLSLWRSFRHIRPPEEQRGDNL